jgi:hypothetical protein
MHVAFVIYHYDPGWRDVNRFYTHFREDLLGGTDPALWGFDRISLVCRAAIDSDQIHENINIHLRRDNLPHVLHWHQKPELLFDFLKEIDPDVIHAFSLNLPLHYRWLRKTVGPGVCLVAHHTGEHHWIQLKLWMQQFGLRVVNGFVFRYQEDTSAWLKSAVILPSQAVIALSRGRTGISRDRLIPDMYQELLGL